MEGAIGYIVSAILGITAVGTAIAKMQATTKYLSLAASVITFVDEVIKSLADKQLTEQEIKMLAAKSVEIKEAYNLIRKK